jgi:hypothetical protein
MKFLPSPFTPTSAGRSKLQRARVLSRYASGPIRITLRSVEVIPDSPTAKTETFHLPLPAPLPRRRSADPVDGTVLLLL